MGNYRAAHVLFGSILFIRIKRLSISSHGRAGRLSHYESCLKVTVQVNVMTAEVGRTKYFYIMAPPCMV